MPRRAGAEPLALPPGRGRFWIAASMSESPATAPPSKALVFARRTGSTLGLWALVTTIFLSHQGWAYLGLIALLALVAVAEYFRMVKAAGLPSFPKIGLAVSAAYCLVMHAGLLRGAGVPPWLDGAALFVLVAACFTMQLRHPIRGPETLHGVALTVLGFLYIPFLFQFAARLVYLVPEDVPAGRVGDQGAFLLLWLLAVTKFTDMGAYITGSMLGRHKMIPHVSPGKTWEGFAGALLFSQLAACGLFAAFPEQLATLGGYGHVVTLGFLLAILAVIGDLAESVVKRALGAKDSGRFLPGIGGSLDLIDSVCFTAPAMVFYLKWTQNLPT